MPRDSNGNYSFLPTSFTPAVQGTVIDANANNEYLSDVQQTFTNSIASNGVTPIQADLPMTGHKHTGVTSADAPDQYSSAQQVAEGFLTFYAVDPSGTGDMIKVINDFALDYQVGMQVTFKALSTNSTSTPTIQVNNNTPKLITINDGTLMQPGAIQAGVIYTLVYDGSSFVLIRTTQAATPMSGKIKERIGITLNANTFPNDIVRFGIIVDQGVVSAKDPKTTIIPLISYDGSVPAGDLVFELGYLYDFILVGAGGLNLSIQKPQDGCIAMINDVYFTSGVSALNFQFSTASNNTGIAVYENYINFNNGLGASAFCYCKNGINAALDNFNPYFDNVSTTLNSGVFYSGVSSMRTPAFNSNMITYNSYGYSFAPIQDRSKAINFGQGIGTINNGVTTTNSIRSPYLQITKKYM